MCCNRRKCTCRKSGRRSVVPSWAPNMTKYIRGMRGDLQPNTEAGVRNAPYYGLATLHSVTIDYKRLPIALLRKCFVPRLTQAALIGHPLRVLFLITSAPWRELSSRAAPAATGRGTLRVARGIQPNATGGPVEVITRLDLNFSLADVKRQDQGGASRDQPFFAAFSSALSFAGPLNASSFGFSIWASS